MKHQAAAVRCCACCSCTESYTCAVAGLHLLMHMPEVKHTAVWLPKTQLCISALCCGCRLITL